MEFSGHARQAVSSDALMVEELRAAPYFPVGHNVHKDAASEEEKLPLAHAVHASVPFVSLNVPKLQGAQMEPF